MKETSYHGSCGGSQKEGARKDLKSIRGLGLMLDDFGGTVQGSLHWRLSGSGDKSMI